MVVKSRNTKVDSDSQFKFKMVCGVVLPRSNSNSSAEPDASTTGLNMHQKCRRWEDAQASGIIGKDADRLMTTRGEEKRCCERVMVFKNATVTGTKVLGPNNEASEELSPSSLQLAWGTTTQTDQRI
jgi:hypothetical protein